MWKISMCHKWSMQESKNAKNVKMHFRNFFWKIVLLCNLCKNRDFENPKQQFFLAIWWFSKNNDFSWFSMIYRRKNAHNCNFYHIFLHKNHNFLQFLGYLTWKCMQLVQKMQFAISELVWSYAIIFVSW